MTFDGYWACTAIFPQSEMELQDATCALEMKIQPPKFSFKDPTTYQERRKEGRKKSETQSWWFLKPKLT